MNPAVGFLPRRASEQHDKAGPISLKSRCMSPKSDGTDSDPPKDRTGHQQIPLHTIVLNLTLFLRLVIINSTRLGTEIAVEGWCLKWVFVMVKVG